jgi:hypothetical protein
MRKIFQRDQKAPIPIFNAYIKPDVRQITLTINSLEKLKDTPNKHNRKLLRLFENIDFVRYNSLDLNEDRVQDWMFLKDQSRYGNSAQRNFVDIALNTPDFAILDGPPGSGKTTTILELIYQLIIRDKKILLVGSTHVSVDNVIEKLMDPYLDVHEKITELLVPMRTGNSEKHPISDFAADYTIHNLWEKKKFDLVTWLESLRVKSEPQTEWLSMLNNKKESNLIRSSLLKSNSLTCGTTIGITRHEYIAEANNQKKNKPLFDYLILDEASKTTFQEFLIPGLYAEKFVIIGDLKQLTPFVDEDGLSLNLGDLKKFPAEERYWKTVANNYKQLNGTPKKAIIIYDRVEGEAAFQAFRTLEDSWLEVFNINKLDRLAYADVVLIYKYDFQKYSNLFSAAYTFILDASIPSNSNGDMNSENTRDANFKLLKFDRRLHPILRKKINFATERNLVKNLKTNHQDDSWEEALSWRMIRLNEVKNLNNNYKNELIATINKLLPNEKDLKEEIELEFADLYNITLPSILKLLQEGLKLPIFKPRPDINTTLTQGIPPSDLDVRFIRLDYQHRMHPEISQFARENFYEGQALMDSNQLKRNLPNYNLYNSRMMWIDVINDSGDEKENTTEIKQIFKELDKILKYLKSFNSTLWEIAILTFYKAQRKQIFETFNKNKQYRKERARTYYHKNVDHVKIVIDVVDSFQGHEADFVLLSMVRNSGIGFLDNPNRLNVALTRAKFQLLVIGNKRHFAKQKRSEHLLRLTKIPTERGVLYDN